MRTARQAAEHTMHLAEQHLAQQEGRIERQKELIASLEGGGHTEMAQAARQLLVDMAALLATMHDDLAQAEARWMAQDGQANAAELPPEIRST